MSREKLEGKRVIASVSGGKDSAALSLYLTEQGIEHDRVFMDTGWEHEATYEYLRGPLQDKIGPILWLKPELQMEELVVKKGIFPTRLRRFCTEKLKVIPFKKHVQKLQDQGIDPVSAVGIRAQESRARSEMGEWEWNDSFDCHVWRPLINWTVEDVIAIHKRHDLRPNPLYLLGATRVGCWPCIYARKDEIRFMAEADPERINHIRELESRVTESARAVVAKRGEELSHPRGFFQDRSGKSGYPWTIDQSVAWSRTNVKDTSPEDSGCFRWGMCDTATPSATKPPEPGASASRDRQKP